MAKRIMYDSIIIDSKEDGLYKNLHSVLKPENLYSVRDF